MPFLLFHLPFSSCSYSVLGLCPWPWSEDLIKLESMHFARPSANQRGPDCLAEVLRDFLALDLASLPKEELHAWLVTVTQCLTVFIEHDGRSNGTSLGSAGWVEAVANRLAQVFPEYRRPMI
jgi:hypothetical protein